MAADDNIKHSGGVIAAILDRLAVLLKGKSAGDVERLFQAVKSAESIKKEEFIN